MLNIYIYYVCYILYITYLVYIKIINICFILDERDYILLIPHQYPHSLKASNPKKVFLAYTLWQFNVANWKIAIC